MELGKFEVYRKGERIRPLRNNYEFEFPLYLGQRVKYHGWNLKVTEQSYD